MKPYILLIMVLATALSPIAAHAQTDTARELKRLQVERDKALAVATEPVMRRYQAALELLLRRATQVNDLETAVKIRSEMEAAVPLANRLINTKWIWFEDQTITFLADGKLQWSGGRDLWQWKVVDSERRLIECVRADNHATVPISFDLSVKNGTVEGEGSRQIHVVARK